jgi:hypothetical protein
VLVLPRVMAMSTEEVEAVKAFVRDGGAVLADALPGILSGHCRKLDGGALDEVFGVRHKDAAKPDAPAGQLAVAGNAEGLSVGTWTQGTQLPTRRVVLDGGLPLGKMGDTPALIVHRFGRGKACYLNLSMAKYLDFRANGTEGALRDRIRRILAWAGARQTIEAGAPSGTPIAKLEVFRHVVAPATIAAFVLESDTDQRGRVTFPTPGHVYDLRKGAYLGRRKSFNVTFPGHDALILAHLPYKVTGVSVSPSRATPGAALAVDIRVAATAKPALHCIRLEVIGPNGKPIEHLARNVLTRQGRGTAALPFALNDAPGRYTVHARDVTTGAAAEAVITPGEGGG